nr:recombinase family protein [uncultured Cellulosilyticum sp.]
MAIYGYARCSTDESRQDINRQKRELKALGCTDENNMYWEYESGTRIDRVELGKLLGSDKQEGIIQEGDTIVTTEVSRITRSTKQLCEIIDLVQKKHLKLVIGTFIVDCTKGELDPMTEGMLKMMGVFAEMERNMISQRVKSGMANAIAKGKVVGRPATTTENLPSSFVKHYPKYKSKQINKTELARLCDMSRQSVYKYIKIYEEQV